MRTLFHKPPLSFVNCRDLLDPGIIDLSAYDQRLLDNVADMIYEIKNKKLNLIR